MATCVHCKTQETQLYENGTPICIACAQGPSIRRRPVASQEDISAMLLQDVLLATAQYAPDKLLSAHSRLNDYLDRGIVPEDLKRSA